MTLLVGDGDGGGSIDVERSVRQRLVLGLQQAHASVPIECTLGTGNLDIRALELALASKDDAVISIVVGGNR